MSKIVITGRWALVWGIWHVALIAGLVWAITLGGDFARWYFRALYTVFLPLELVGVYQNRHDTDVDKARTMSEVRQYVAQVGKGPWPLGWKALAAGSAFMDAGVIGWAVYDIHPWLGAVTGTVMFLWLAAHFAYRERVG